MVQVLIPLYGWMKLAPLLEINIVRADMRRTSLIGGIVPFCFTCASNIRLV